MMKAGITDEVMTGTVDSVITYWVMYTYNYVMEASRIDDDRDVPGADEGRDLRDVDGDYGLSYYVMGELTVMHSYVIEAH